MANLTVTNVDLGNVILQNAEFSDDTLTLAANISADAGLILARNTTSGFLVPFAVAGTGGTGIPLAILTYDVEGSVAGGDFPIRAGVSGSYRKERLIILAQAPSTVITKAISDLLRDYSLIPIDVTELNFLDNQ